jgi:hypothetical protein
MAQRVGAAAIREFHPTFPGLEASADLVKVLNRAFGVGK